MKPAIKRSGLFVLAALLGAANPASAQGTKPLPGGLTLTETTLVAPSWLHGMLERRFIIDNPTSETKQLQFEYPAHSFSGEGLASLSHTVLANAGMRTSVVMHQPPTPIRGNSATIAVTVGRNSPEMINCRQPHFVNKRYISTCPLSLLVSKGLSAEALKTHLVAAAPATRSSSHNYLRGSKILRMSNQELAECLFNDYFMEQLMPVRFEAEGSAWPQHWLAYSAFDGCLIEASDYENMPAAARRALQDYAAAGGHVTLLGMDVLPADWRRETDIYAGLDAHTQQMGAGVTLGFGRAAAIAATTSASITSNDLARLVTSWSTTARPWLSSFEKMQDNLSAIPVAGNLRVPIRSFIFILLLFTLLAGPGAVLFTRRANRRIWLLGLVPAFSLLFSLAILIYALISEGITPSIRRQAITLLNQTQKRAATLGAIGIYAPVSLRDGLYFDLGTEISPISSVRSGRIHTSGRQHYSTGWIRPRMAAFFRLRRSEMRAERLIVVEHQAGEIEIVNALGATVEFLRLSDSAGHVYETHVLAPGESRTLSSVQPRQAHTSKAYRQLQLFEQDRIDAGWNIADLAKTLLSKKGRQIEPPISSYLAVLQGAPFIENPLAYCRTQESAHSVVLGWYGTK